MKKRLGQAGKYGPWSRLGMGMIVNLDKASLEQTYLQFNVIKLLGTAIIIKYFIHFYFSDYSPCHARTCT